jgi:hypothetical protein
MHKDLPHPQTRKDLLLQSFQPRRKGSPLQSFLQQQRKDFQMRKG